MDTDPGGSLPHEGGEQARRCGGGGGGADQPTAKSGRGAAPTGEWSARLRWRRPLRHQRHEGHALANTAGHASEAHGVEGFGEVQRRQNGREPPRQHRLARPRGAEHEVVWVTTPASRSPWHQHRERGDSLRWNWSGPFRLYARDPPLPRLPKPYIADNWSWTARTTGGPRSRTVSGASNTISAPARPVVAAWNALSNALACRNSRGLQSPSTPGQLL
jgi:hypothetical protein